MLTLTRFAPRSFSAFPFSSLSFSSLSSAPSTSTPSEPEDDKNVIQINPHPSHPGIVIVSLNRPGKHNALSYPLFEAIAETAADLAKRKDVRAVIIKGNGKSFCSGLDVVSMAKSPSTSGKVMEKPGKYNSFSNLAQDVGYLWRACPFPVIASLHGKCWGGGMQIALGADFRFTTPTCTFAILEAKWGLIPDMSGTVTLRELVRLDVIKELAMTGRIIDANEAERVGLVTRVVDDPYEEAVKLAVEIAGRSPDAVASTKKLFQETYMASEEVALDKETTLQLELMPTWNQMVASAKNFTSIPIPYINRK